MCGCWTVFCCSVCKAASLNGPVSHPAAEKRTAAFSAAVITRHASHDRISDYFFRFSEPLPNR
jgi:hypothetical protein